MKGGVDSALHDRLLNIIGRGASTRVSDLEFESLALALFAYQYERNPLYRAYCESRGATPTTVSHSALIPAVPTDAFKSAALLCGDPNDAEAIFLTSGTTAGSQRRGAHYMVDTRLYRASLRAGFAEHLMPGQTSMRIASLVPSPEEVPDSSLSFMIGDVITQIGTSRSGFYASPEGLDVKGFLAAAEDSIRRDEPMLLPGTSFAFVHLVDALAERKLRLDLPAGSRVMDTGGFKGRTRDVERGELYRLIGEWLGIPASHIVNEFGMTEMSSQLYDGVVGSAAAAGEPRIHTPPGWLKTVAVDPETLDPLPGGTVGILRHLDLANMHSVIALQSADLGRTAPDGVEMLGRAGGAEPRGCSIAMDELLSLIRSRGADPGHG